MTPLALEIFPCSGGMAEGFRRAGITFDVAFDYSKEACDSYEANLGHRPVQMDARDLLRLVQSGWRPAARDIDLLVADPPCTPWSRAGKRLGVEDERDMLGVTCELIRLLRPRAYLIGNVPGLDDSTQWHHLQAALAPLAKEGYCIRDYASLDAADFGVPQHRVRPFWFGHLAGPCLRWPMPTHGAPTDNTCLPGTALKPWVTCREALGHLSAADLGRPVRLRRRAEEDGGHPASEPDSPARTLTASGGRAGKRASVLMAHPDHNLSSADAPAKTVTRNTHGDGSILVNTRHQPARLDAPAPTLTAKIRGQSGQVLSAARPHHRTDPDRPARTMTTSRQDNAKILSWPWDSPATSVTTTDRLPPPGHHPETGSILSQPNAVVLSERAALILQGFPESWRLIAKTKTARWSMLGQAMPPALAEAVARGVVEHFESHKSKGAA